MNTHVNVENDEVTVPYYAIHKDGLISGFFGPFRWLSNFYILKNGVWFDDLTYPSTEHAYQAAKWPKNKRTQFLDVTAGESKKLGKLAPNLDVRKWNKEKVALMSSLVHQKFQKNDTLRKMLFETDGFELEERNSWGDVYWGVDVNGQGENKLGKILMAARANLQDVEENGSF